MARRDEFCVDYFVGSPAQHDIFVRMVPEVMTSQQTYLILRLSVMITVQRRWFIPPHLYDEFRLRWLEEMGPVLPSLPGFIRAEIYDSAIPEQWTTLVSWDTKEHRVSAILTEEAIGFYARYSQYEKGLAETLYLIGKIEAQPMSLRRSGRTANVVPGQGA